MFADVPVTVIGVANNLENQKHWADADALRVRRRDFYRWVRVQTEQWCGRRVAA